MTQHENPAGLALPTGARPGPNCGITALAIVTKKPFDVIWDMFALNRGKSWKGRTYLRELTWVLDKYSIKNELRLARRMSLHRWSLVYAKTGVTYIVRTGGHFQVVKDGWCIDQSGPAHVTKFWGRKKRLTHIIEIHN